MVVFGALAFFALPLLPTRYPESLIPDTCGQGGLTQSLSDVHQLHLATEAMAADGIMNGNTNLGWPGDKGGSFSHWATMLVRENYIPTNDFCKLLSAPAKVVPQDPFPAANTNGILVYALAKTTPEDTVFLSTANFTNSRNDGFKLLATPGPMATRLLPSFEKTARATFCAESKSARPT